MLKMELDDNEWDFQNSPGSAETSWGLNLISQYFVF